MTPSRFRLLLRDLAAGAAFGSIAISGEIPLWATALFVSGLFTALMGYRIFSRAGLVTAIILGVVALFLFLLVLTGKLDLVVAACTFAALLTLQRLLAASSPSTDGHVYFTSLLMLSGGAALSGELLFGLAVFLFAFCAILSMGLGVVQGAAGSEPFPTRAVTCRLAFGSVAAIAGSVLFFAAFPRLSWNVAPQRMTRGLGGATTGLSDRISLSGSAGQLKRNPRVVSHVKIKPDPKMPSLKEHWFAHALEDFDGLQWRPTGHNEVIGQRVQLETGLASMVRQEFEILPAFGSTTLIALGRPVEFENAISLNGNSRRQTALLLNRVQDEVRLSAPAQSFTYEALSARSTALPNKNLSQAERRRLLQQPSRLDPRIAQLAAQIAGSEPGLGRKAQLLETFLSSNYQYSLDFPGNVDDPLSHFLFEKKAGHCEYFASALAILLRTQGIPSRVATGFYGGERQGDRYILRAGDAHAWTQGWINGEWATFDATPEADRTSQAFTALAWLASQYDALENFWRGAVLEYSGKDQIQFVAALSEPRVAAGQRASRGAKFPPQGYLFASLLSLCVLWFGIRSKIRLRDRGSDARRLRRCIERAVIRFLNYRAAHEGLEEFAARLSRERHPASPALSLALARYLSARFGSLPLGRAERVRLERALKAACKPSSSCLVR